MPWYTASATARPASSISCSSEKPGVDISSSSRAAASFALRYPVLVVVMLAGDGSPTGVVLAAVAVFLLNDASDATEKSARVAGLARVFVPNERLRENALAKPVVTTEW